jgi:FG-GAP repeat
MRRLAVLTLLCLLVAPAHIGRAGSGGGASGGGGGTVAGDFDGDGYEDLVISSDSESIRGVEGAGAVHVLYGSRRGPTATGDDFWHQARRGVPGAVEEFARFGRAVAAGDFDGDGRDDLAIGIPFDDVGAAEAAGTVYVLYGTAKGLTTAGDQLWHPGRPGVVGPLQGSDQFGATLAAGNFDGDRRDDLAIAAPFGDIGAPDGVGYVHLLYGSRNGLTARNDSRFDKDTPGIPGDPTEFGFGDTLAAGNLGWSGADDLAIGAPEETVDGNPDSGAVYVLRGSRAGITGQGSQLWHQNVSGVEGQADSGTEFFGSALAAANFGAGRFADLAIGVVNEDFLGFPNAGAVNVLYGSPTGLTSDGDQLWWQGVTDIEGDPETDDILSIGLAAGDLGKSRHADLAAGAINADIGGFASAGEVNVIYGSETGLTTSGDQLWTQDSAGILDAADDATGTGGFGDEFGFALSAGRYDGRGRADLAVDANGEDVAGVVDAGAVHVIFSRAGGLVPRRDQFWHQARQGIPDSPEEDDRLGRSLL